MKKFSIFLSILIAFSFQTNSYSNEEIVDLHKNHWAYNSCIKVINKYKLMSIFPDHTFRGNKNVNNFDLSSITLKLIKNIEESGIKAKKNSIKVSYNSDFFIEAKENKIYGESISELTDKYQIPLSFSDNNKFDGKKIITRIDLALTINSILNIFVKVNKEELNPYEDIPDKIEAKEYETDKLIDLLIKDLSSKKIMSINSKNHNEIINRYELAVTIVKTLEYINNSQKHHF